jgi:ABC-2 type transport system permease protein
VLVGLLWFILGFFLYATLFAAAGSLVSRSEDLQAVVTPITILVLIPFLVSFTIIDNPTGTLAQVMSVVPFFAPILMPVLFSLGAVAGWQLAVALALTVVTIGLIALLAGRVYSNSVLRTGGRVKLREAFSPMG